MPIPAVIGFAASLALALALADLWRRRGWGDSSSGSEAGRKLQAAAVPAVGGLAIAGGWCAQFVSGKLLGRPESETLADFARALPGMPPGADPLFVASAAALALLVALAVGSLDDIRAGGLPPAPKLVLQMTAGLPIALPSWFPEGLPSGLDPSLPALFWTAFWATAAAFAQNVWNTFDNADGAATSIASLALAAVGQPTALAPLGFLVPNLALRRGAGLGRRHGPGRDPLAYLGDAGSHLLGMALLLTPAAWPGFLLPLLDLCRVSVRRLRRGIPPWKGDLRHLAHDLARRGLGPVAVVLVLCAITTPVLWSPDLAGFAGTLVLFATAALAVRRAR